MVSGNRVSLDTVLWKVTRGPLYEQLNPDDAAMYAKEAIRQIGAPLIYKNIVTIPPLEVVNHKVAVPADSVHIRGIRLITDEDNFENNPIPLTYATDIFHGSRDCELEDIEYPVNHPREYTYTIEAGIITTSVSSGKIQVSYQALDVCENGYPLLPDDENVLRAIEYHIRMRYLEPLWESGLVPDKVYNNVAQNRDWYIGSAQSKTRLHNLDHVEATMNAVNRLIIPSTHMSHKDSFKRLGKKESIKRYN